MLTVVPLTVSTHRTADGGLIISLRYSYDDAASKPPNRKRRIEMTRALLRSVLDRLEAGEAADIVLTKTP